MSGEATDTTTKEDSMERREYNLEHASGKIVVHENGKIWLEFTTGDHNEEPRTFVGDLNEVVTVVEA